MVSFGGLPDTEKGGAIVDDDGAGGWEKMVIGLTLRLGDELHLRQRIVGRPTHGLKLLRFDSKLEKVVLVCIWVFG